MALRTWGCLDDRAQKVHKAAHTHLVARLCAPRPSMETRGEAKTLHFGGSGVGGRGRGDLISGKGGAVGDQGVKEPLGRARVPQLRPHVVTQVLVWRPTGVSDSLGTVGRGWAVLTDWEVWQRAEAHHTRHLGCAGPHSPRATRPGRPRCTVSARPRTRLLTRYRVIK